MDNYNSTQVRIFNIIVPLTLRVREQQAASSKQQAASKGGDLFTKVALVVGLSKLGPFH